MIPSQKHLFDIPNEVTYLNCAYLSPQLKSVQAAGIQGVSGKSSPWELMPQDFFTESELCRTLFAEIMGADRENVAFIPSASYGIAVAAANLKLKSGDEVVVLAEQFPSNYYVWKHVANLAGASIRTVPKTDSDTTAVVLDTIIEKTAIVAIPNCHWADGASIDIQSVSDRCAEVGAALVLDLSQSAGVMSIDLDAVNPDFVITVGYKWLLGPYSFGYMIINKKHHDGPPLEYNWMARENSEDFSDLVLYRDAFQPGARKFDVGERSNFVLMPMAMAALKQISEWGVGNIENSLSHFTDEIAKRAFDLGLTIRNKKQRAPHLLGIQFQNGVPNHLTESLKRENIYVSVRGNSMRIAPYLYNTNKDIDRLFSAIKQSL
ncbi:MAG: aminotransferase class V-fold PLP-dependent enzyme [Candidatus Marinimicrobia bacterium]|nr:aminotransferase class V-fold PLP-dependent enzyme [Candidatus Neomarinimicrobiota bacterium]MBL7011046.1 aminotransferase class V-fold PLP-dependent enzyme [Candidatus Neomarinimicrobiota bacterium]MBL7031401.1 aminotransferase class V-fold PLP-dependent enzyme [Candidatus Neomarinimicrobiota bacterium]